MTDNSAGFTVRFDHVALAMRRATDLWPVMAAVLGGRFVARGDDVGYGWTHLRFANGFVLEGLYPESNQGSEGDPADPEFLTRFLDSYGPGPHHLTFEVDDLEAAVARLREGGHEPFMERDDGPHWHEVILHPLRSHGIVVQVVQRTATPMGDDPPEGFPSADYDQPVASLGRVVHAVADLDSALALFRDVLGGREVSSGSAIDGNHWVELGWEGPGRLRLLQATHGELAVWLGGRTGRLRHLFFNFDEPAIVPGAERVATGRWVVDHDDLTGVRLVFASSAR